ncbi:hypothetical protein [Moorena sp. SIO3B2]|uniref:hypothetical protein n=1 Tax=Moorena sp. SIO3B2 TaxID=2607827 RepID=UPI0013C5DC6C|nr:hypothetical protein [Moorena sp. SIO3B2]NEP31354.1 hypothetical protein [Moorena sp. SIO3B2]
MLHLAQVQDNNDFGGLQLQLLARQNSDQFWEVIEPRPVAFTNSQALKEGCLVLIDLAETQEVISIQSATDWVLDLVKKYLTAEVKSTFLEEEMKRAEQWRQELTLKSQGLDIRDLEVEARREKIEALAENLKLEKKQLEQKVAQLEAKIDEAGNE